MSDGFDLEADSDARVLILGSLPGKASLACGEYYAQQRNAFWPIMAELVGAELTLPYEYRLQRIRGARLALWDVCARAARVGSLNGAIQTDSVAPNDIAGFLRSHGDVRLICFNGAKADQLFQRLVLPELSPEARAIRRLTLPSTSPANAAISFKKKLEAWRAILDQAET